MMPTEPTALEQAAQAMHEMFITYVAAGFTEGQALKLIALVFTTIEEDKLEQPPNS